MKVAPKQLETVAAANTVWRSLTRTSAQHFEDDQRETLAAARARRHAPANA